MELGLRGRTALVTGGSKGIGRAVAAALAEEGAHLHLAARTQSELEAARDAIAGRVNVNVTIHPTDLSQTEAVLALAERCRDVDILVNNAGAIPAGTLQTVDGPRWREAWDLKVFGYIDLCRAMLPHMAARRAGVILNIIGTGGERHDPKYIAGAVGNASLIAFTKTLGGVSVDDGVRVLGINPGRIETDRLVTLLRRRAELDHGDPERWREYMTDLPFGRPGRPEEVADLATFLVSDRAGYISGTVVTIDGGAVMRV